MGNKDPVTLVSSDGFEYVIDHDAACVSNTIKHMLASEGKKKEKTNSGEGHEKKNADRFFFYGVLFFFL